MPLLGFMAASAANQYAQMKNAETDQQNKMGFAIIQAEMENNFRQRLAERQHELGIERDRVKQEEVRITKEFEHGKKVELEGVKHENKLQQEKERGGIQRSIEGMRQDRSDARTSASIASREKVALLNKSTEGLSAKDLTKSIESDRKEMFQINKDLTDPLTARNPETSRILKERLRELEGRVALKTKQMGGDKVSSKMQSLYDSDN